MALMDIISLSSDKQAVIFDIGHAYTKVGFAGEQCPRHIIASEVHFIRNGNLEVSPLYKPYANEDEMYEIYRGFLHMIYFKYLLVNPKERRVVVCESMFQSIQFRKVLANVLFKHFEVVSVLFAPSHLVALFALGIKSGLVVDCGFEESCVVPVFEQTPIIGAAQFVNLAGRQLHSHIRSRLMDSGFVQVQGNTVPAKQYANELTEDVLEDLKVRCCFVGRRKYNHPATDIHYPLPGGKSLLVDGYLRANAFDTLFESTDDNRSLATIILNAIIESPIDCRRILGENVFLIGGTSMSPGFESRIIEEVQYLLQTPPYSSKLKVPSIKIRKSLTPKNYCAWLGAAIFGALEVLTDHSISRDRYYINQTIPDWSSVLALPRDGSEKNDLDGTKYHLTSFRPGLPQGTSVPAERGMASLSIKGDVDSPFKAK